MKKYFITGLIISLPLALTIAIVIFLFNLFTIPFSGIVEAIFERYNILEKGFGVFSSMQIRQYVSQVLVLIFIICFLTLLGFVARGIYMHYVIKIGEYVVERIPFIRGVYKTSKDLVNTLFKTDSTSFKQAVLVPFPHPNSYGIGLVTREDLPSIKGSERIAVFMPTTPNPTSGFLMLVKREDVIYLDMPVENALKYIISCGVSDIPLTLKVPE